MKKILLIIFLFFCCTTVYAQERKFYVSEYISGISYVKYDGKTHYYRNAPIIKDASTGEIAYCIEPFTLLVDYTTYSSDSSYNSRYNISKENWDKAKLIAYYGYGYKGHTDKKWISITQLTIWRTLYPNYQFDWIDNTTSRKTIYPYNSEIKELNDLVNSHYTLPSLDESYEFGINESLEINDTNNVLSNYTIKSSDFDVSISNNKLIIKTTDEEKEGKIVFERAGKKYNDSVLFYYNSSSQNVIERGNITPVNFEIKIKVSSGKIIVEKIDNETNENIPQGDASLDGAIFELYDEDMKFLEEGTVENGFIEFENLSFGKYYIKEKTPGKGYYLNNEIYEIEINENNLEPQITIGNDIIKSKVKIIKFYGTKKDYNENKMKIEKGITFDIYNKNNELVYSGTTDNDGVIELYLPYGDYVIKQKNTTSGYQLIDDYYFAINEENNLSIDIPFYDFKIEVPNASINIFHYFFYLMRRLYV